MKKSIGICEVQNKKIIDNDTMLTTYKVKSGGIINVKSTFNNQRTFKNAIFPAILTTLKSMEKA